MNIQYIPINKILPAPYRLRKSESKLCAEPLIKSISNMGILQPLILRSMNGFFEIVSGTRRFEAAKALGIQKVPSVIIKINDLESIQISLAENIQRKNLSFLEEADAFQMMMSYFGCSKSEISDKIGESESFVIKRLKTLSLDNSVKKIICGSNITVDEASKLSSLDAKAQIDAANKIKQSRQSENIIFKAALNNTLNSVPIEKDIRLFSAAIKEAVNKVKDYGFKTSCVIMKSHSCCNINIKVSL